MKRGYLLLFLAVGGLLSVVIFLSARMYLRLGDIDTGQSSIALGLGGLIALGLIAGFIRLTLKGGRDAKDRSDPL